MRVSSTAVYETLSRLPVPQSYFGKVVAVAAVGTQLPLVAVAGYLAAAGPPAVAPGPVLLVTLAATLAGAALTIALLRGLVAPVARAANELQAYLNTGELPTTPDERPARTTDLAGLLLRGVRYAAARLDELARAREAAPDIDAVTGVYNRAAGRQRLEEEIARVKREGGDFALGLVDLDRFEALSARHGHAFTDRCLRRLAEALTGTLRRSDWIARCDNRQFLVGLAGTGEATLVSALGRAYRALEAAPVPTPDGSPLPLSISVGLAQMRPADDAAALVDRAEHGLYVAKRRGRNTVVYVSPDMDITQDLAA